MAVHIDVLCKREVAFTYAELERVLRRADLVTLAEGLSGIADEAKAVKAMWKMFRIENDEIRWHAKQRPIQFESEPPIDGELDEILEEIRPTRRKGAALVRAHVARTTWIVRFSMGADGACDVAWVIAEVLAYHLAERGDGIVMFDRNEFALPSDQTKAVFAIRR